MLLLKLQPDSRVPKSTASIVVFPRHPMLLYVYCSPWKKAHCFTVSTSASRSIWKKELTISSVSILTLLEASQGVLCSPCTLSPWRIRERQPLTNTRGCTSTKSSSDTTSAMIERFIVGDPRQVCRWLEWCSGCRGSANIVSLWTHPKAGDK